MMPDLRLIVYLFLLSTVLPYALWKGGSPERWIATMLLGAAWGSWLVVSSGGDSFRTIEFGVAVIDAALLVGMLAVTVHADRYWTLWITAFQIIQVLAHVPEILVPELLPEIYGLIISVWSYPMLLILLAGTWRHRQRINRFGSDRPWSDFSVQQG